MSRSVRFRRAVVAALPTWRGFAITAAGLALLLSAPLVGSPRAVTDVDPSTVPTSPPEQQLVRSLIELRQGRLEEALLGISDLVDAEPRFKLAKLVYADLLSAQSGSLDGFGHAAPSEFVDGLRLEARARLARYVAGPPAELLPASILKLPESTERAIVVDLLGYRLYVLNNEAGRPSRSEDYYVSIGKGGTDKRFEGDEKTPVGVYRVSSYLPGAQLPDEYGEGAFPIDYPNRWDRSLRRTGDGIWIHGTESASFSRPPQSSRGCVTLSNRDFLEIRGGVEVGKTPVVLADSLEWVPAEKLRSEALDIERSVEAWRHDWESLDTDAYLSHYSRDFRTPDMDRDRFAAHKRRVNSNKTSIEIDISDIGIFRYPGEQELIFVEFKQQYRSNNFGALAHKQQYWTREGGAWRILYEDSVARP